MGALDFGVRIGMFQTNHHMRASTVPYLPAELWQRVASSCEANELASLVGASKETRDAVYDAMSSSSPPSVVCDEDGHSMFCNREQVQAFVRVALLGRSTFLTGGAGTGKSFVTRKIVNSVMTYLGSYDKVLVVAPTGAAARVASTSSKIAQTIHFAFNISSINRFESDPPYKIRRERGGSTSSNSTEVVLGTDFDPFDDPDEKTADGRSPLPTAKITPEVNDVLSRIKLLVIDEISMVSNETFTLIDESLQYCNHSKRPFGGVTVLCVGDFCQLPPVISSLESSKRNLRMGGPWAFQSKSWTFQSIALRTIIRQKDSTFASVLNRIRLGRASWSDASWINRHNFRPTDTKLSIFPSNEACRERNCNEMQKLVRGGAEKVTFESIQFVTKLLSTQPWRMALIPPPHESLPKIVFPEALSVTICVGARVRAIKNIYKRDDGGVMNLEIANGQRGTVLSIRRPVPPLLGSVVVLWDALKPGEDPEEIEVFMSRRSKRQKFKVDDKFVYGSSTFLPLSLAWAITVHAAQGASVDIPVDLNHRVRTCVDDQWVPQAGGAYVALSRATDIAHVKMLQRFHPNDAVMDSDVKRFMASNGLM